MSLTQLVVEIPGGLIKSADWNGEFANIYNNPITLISPTTGAINFNLQGHTNLVPTAITATSASNGNVLTVVAGAPAWAQATPSVLTTVNTSTGAIFTVSSSGAVVVIPLGTSGQVLTVTTTQIPASFQTPAASAATFDPEATFQFYEDFVGALSTAFNATGSQTFSYPWGLFFGAGGAELNPGTSANVQGNMNKGVLRITSQGGNAGVATLGSTGSNNNQPLSLFFNSSDLPTFKCRWALATTGVDNYVMCGFSTIALITSAVGTNSLYFVSTAAAAQVKLSSRNAGTETLSAGLGVTATAPHAFQAVVTTSQINILVDGVLTTSITTNISTSPMGPSFGTNNANTSGGIDLDYFFVKSSR